MCKDGIFSIFDFDHEHFSINEIQRVDVLVNETKTLF